MTDTLDRLTTALADRYRVERELGAGGMATVYLARDLRHDRNVALKVLRPELAAAIGADRFLAEIRTTANLQHPHIVPLFESGRTGGPGTEGAHDVLYYVMPFIEGESLRDRLTREKQLPVPEAVRIAGEVASALDYAHRHAVVHRDIKPENVLLHDGRVLVADFGIALAASRAGSTRMTETGMSLGTPHYMSPEQAMGEREITARSDVYALGALTYEMLLGEPPFTGPTAQAIVAKVMTERPAPIVARRERVPQHVEDAVLTALEKLPADRFATAAEFAAALATPDPSSRGATRRLNPVASRSVRLLPLAVAMMAGALLVAAAALLARGQSDAAPPVIRRSLIPIAALLDRRGADLAISADGTVLAAGAGFSGILVRRLGEMEARQLPGGAGGNRPFLSADGRRIGFRRGSDLVVQDLDGGEVITLPGGGAFGGTFLDDDRIVLADAAGLTLVDLRSRERRLLTPHPEGGNYQQPFALPGGTRVLFTAVSGGLGDARGVAIGVDDGRIDTLVTGALSTQYGNGWLVYARPNGTLEAIRFDPDARAPSGQPVQFGDRSMIGRTSLAAFAVGGDALVYGPPQRNRLVALDGRGGRTELLTEPGTYHSPRVSPDGRRIVLDRDEGGFGGRDVWLLEIASGALSRVSSAGDGHDPVWTPDGRSISYLSFATDSGPLYTISADGRPGTRRISATFEFNPGTWLPDGSAYLAGLGAPSGSGAAGVGGTSDLIALRPDGSLDTVLATQWDEHSPALSADGRWLAFTSNETGRREVYVRPLRGEGRTLVSHAGGEEPVWSRSGNELYYVAHADNLSRLMVAEIGGQDRPVVAGRRTVLEDFRYEPVGNHTNWDVMPDGRLVVVEPETTGHLVLVTGWMPR